MKLCTSSHGVQLELAGSDEAGERAIEISKVMRISAAARLPVCRTGSLISKSAVLIARVQLSAEPVTPIGEDPPGGTHDNTPPAVDGWKLG
jgi:hypothetical protein